MLAAGRRPARWSRVARAARGGGPRALTSGGGNLQTERWPKHRWSIKRLGLTVASDVNSQFHLLPYGTGAHGGTLVGVLEGRRDVKLLSRCPGRYSSSPPCSDGGSAKAASATV